MVIQIGPNHYMSLVVQKVLIILCQYGCSDRPLTYYVTGCSYMYLSYYSDWYLIGYGVTIS